MSASPKIEVLVPNDLPDATISAAELCKITGWTDHHHRRLAKKGHFPEPKRGKYLLGPTVRGVLRYAKRLSERGGHLTELRAEKLRLEVKRLDLDIDRISGKTIEITTQAEFMLRVSTKLKIRLYQFLEKEMPARAKVDPETAARLTVLGRNLADEMCETLARDFAQWNESRP
jgi:hypothetical protein